MSNKQGASAKSSTDRKRKYDRSMRETHKRLDLRVSLDDMGRIAKLGVKNKELIPTLLSCYDKWQKFCASEDAPPTEAHLPDCGHRAWRRLGVDILDILGCDKPVDVAFLHHLKDGVEGALLEMLIDDPGVAPFLKRAGTGGQAGQRPSA